MVQTAAKVQDIVDVLTPIRMLCLPHREKSSILGGEIPWRIPVVEAKAVEVSGRKGRFHVSCGIHGSIIRIIVHGSGGRSIISAVVGSVIISAAVGSVINAIFISTVSSHVIPNVHSGIPTVRSIVHTTHAIPTVRRIIHAIRFSDFLWLPP